MERDKAIYSLREAAEYCGMDHREFRKHVKLCEVSHIPPTGTTEGGQARGKYRFFRRDLDSFLEWYARENNYQQAVRRRVG